MGRLGRMCARVGMGGLERLLVCECVGLGAVCTPADAFGHGVVADLVGECAGRCVRGSAQAHAESGMGHGAEQPPPCPAAGLW